MKIISTNLSKPVSIRWKGEEKTTGIYKKACPEGILLSPGGVQGDTIGNPRVHGGEEKAAYLFSRDHYPYWQGRYPSLEWEYGMFGENLTVEGLDETQLLMGSTYRIGEALVRVTIPREPCFKLGIRFADQGIIDAFVAHGLPGAYVSVVKAGHVRPGDAMVLQEAPEAGISIASYFGLLFATEKDPALIRKAVSVPWLSESHKEQLRRWQA